jgi:hypothetical protein
MPHHEHVRLHGGKVVHRVQQGFAFGLRGAVDAQVDHVRRQALGGNFKSSAGTSAGFEEQIENCFAAQQRNFLDFAVSQGNEGFGSIENMPEDIGGQPLDCEQVLQFTVFVELRVVQRVLLKCAPILPELAPNN